LAEETWKILISDAPSEVGAAQPQPAQTSASQEEAKDVPKQQKAFFDQFSQYWKSWRPFIVTGGLLYGMYRASQVVSETMKAIWQIFGAIMDVFLAPFVPLIAKILEILAEFVPIVADLAESFFMPIVEALEPILAHILEWIKGIDWSSVEGWLVRAGEFVADSIKVIWNWLSNTVWPWLVDIAPKIWDIISSMWGWLSGTAWPWITTNVPKIWDYLNKAYTWIEQHVPEIKSAIDIVWDYISKGYDWLTTTGWGYIENIYTWMKDTAGPWIADIPNKISDLKNWFSGTLWPALQSALVGILTVLGVVAGAIVGGEIFGRLGAFLGAIGFGIAGYQWAGIINDAVNDLGSSLNSTISQASVDEVKATTSVKDAVIDTQVKAETISTPEAINESKTINTYEIYLSKDLPAIEQTIQSEPELIASGQSVMPSPLWYNDPTLFWQSEFQQLQLGGLIPKTGLYFLHRGEEVVPSISAQNGSPRSNYIEMHNTFNIELQATSSVDVLAKEIERKVTDRLTSIIRRD
jgi:hypothetical protein